MAHITADRVRQTSTSTGTGTIVLSGSLSGFRTFASVLAVSDTFWYAIASFPGSEWEVGLGTYSALNTITRTTVLASSNAGAAVVFSAGDKEVFITAAASKFLQQNAAGSYGNFTAGTITAALTGNASTATTLQTARNINGTSFNGSADVTIGRLYDTSYRRITNPGGAEYVTTTTSVTGAIAITLPVGMSGSMVSMTIKVYEYVTNESFEINCGGYNYATGSTWANSPFAYIVGSPGIDRRFTVRFGYDSVGLKSIIYIGELASTWSYPQVYVTDVQVGFGGQSATWTSGWTIGFEATAFNNVTATITNPQVGYAVSTNTANSVALRDASGNFSAGTITAALTGAASSNVLKAGDTMTGALTVYNATTSIISVLGDSGTAFISARSSNDTTAPGLNFRKYRGTTAVPLTIVTGDSLGNSNYLGYDGSSLITAAQITGIAETVTGTGNISGALTFLTRPAGTGTSATERMRIDSSGNVGLGVVSSAWGTNFKAIESAGNSSVAIAAANINGINISSNAYNDNTNWLYKTTGTAARYSVNSNVHQWFIAPSGTAAAAITFTQAMTLDASGNLLVGATTAGGFKLRATTSGSTVMLAESTSTAAYINISDSTSTNSPQIGSAGNNLVFRTGVSTSDERLRIDTAGNVTPGVTNTQTLGAVGDVWSNVHATTVTATFHESVQTISANYTITSGSNAMTPGPITIASGVTVTVPSGSVWTIV